MEKEKIKKEIQLLVTKFGTYPYDFFNILTDSKNPFLDYDTQNNEWAFIRGESWHDINLEAYQLWATSDNGDLLWWNGTQTILMNPRDQEFISMPIRPAQFIELVKLGKVGKLLPDDILEGDA